MADRENAESNASKTATPDPGQQVSDNLDEFNPELGAGRPGCVEEVGLVGKGGVFVSAPVTPKTIDAFVADLKNRSREHPLLSREFRVTSNNSGMRVTGWELATGDILREGALVPTYFHREGIDCHFFFNPRHSLFQQYAITPKEALVAYLAEKFKSRDNLAEDAGAIFVDLFARYCDESKIDVAVIQESARGYFDKLREAAVDLLVGRAAEAVECVHRSPAEVQDIGMNLAMRRADLMEKFSRMEAGALECLYEAPPRTLIRLVDSFPEAFFDEKFFSFRYATLAFTDPAVNQRIREETLERVVSFLRDAHWILQDQTRPGVDRNGRKEEIQRCAHSLSLLRRNTVKA